MRRASNHLVAGSGWIASTVRIRDIAVMILSKSENPDLRLQKLPPDILLRAGCRLASEIDDEFIQKWVISDCTVETGCRAYRHSRSYQCAAGRNFLSINTARRTPLNPIAINDLKDIAG
jgi:hypothetical protein